MAREKFVDYVFRGESLRLIDVCVEIVGGYLSKGFRLTLRQLYYQLVVRNVIPNIERAYKNLSGLISRARLAGLVDWDAIEDRIRVPVHPPEFNSLEDLVEVAINSFRLPRWKGQDYYVELWVEKDALAGILRPLALQHHVTLLVNRGYGSTSAMYDAANRYHKRLAEVTAAGGPRKGILFYLGDFDPSGEDMVRNIQARFDIFGADVEVRKIALTMAQVHQFNPPPNPVKRTDPRSKEFIRRYGASSWEVDALPPEELDRIIRQAFADVLDLDLMNKVIEQEDVEKELLKKALANLRGSA